MIDKVNRQELQDEGTVRPRVSNALCLSVNALLGVLGDLAVNFVAHQPNRAHECKRLYGLMKLRATLDQSAHTRQ